ncbi:C-C motif chemokine 21 [Pleurodeles waltl]|uniref:C-C motif chemokine 21 n=1 Tax=Pleurodeles waltl TaxID=8319 RepID=UPI003709C1A9
MAPQVPLAALLAALLCALPVQGNDNIALDCCLKTSNHPIQLKILWRYEDQNPDQGCPFPAVVFITKADKKLCAPPKLPWVLKRKKQLDNKKKPGGAPKKTGGKKKNKPNKPNKPKKPKSKQSPSA